MPSDATERKRIVLFCPGCFTTSDGDGSWAHGCDEEYCYNCGHGCGLPLPRWAVESIREQASWIGKRYYPHDEDRQIQAELTALRAFAPDNPTDRAEWNDEGWYTVYRDDPATNSEIGIMPIYADSPEEAIQKAKTKLRYTPTPEGGADA